MLFNFISALIPTVSIIACLWCMFNKNAKTVIQAKSTDKPWKFGTWLAGIFIAGMGTALVTNVPGDLAGLLQRGWNPIEAITMVSVWNGIPVWGLYTLVGYWYIKHMDSKFGKYMAMLSTILGMSISLWTGSNATTRMLGIKNVVAFKFILASITLTIAYLSAHNNYLKKVSRTAVGMLIICGLILLSTDKSNINPNPITGTITSEFWNEYWFGGLSASWWSWFLLWCPTVSRWLAHISNGKTVRSYFFFSTIVPSIFCCAWVILSYKYSDAIANMDLFANPTWWFPTIALALTGIMFMAGTLDSDCKVFTEDLESVSDGKIKQKKSMPFYCFMVLFFFSLYVSGIIVDPWSFALYSSVVFFPIWGMSMVEVFKK